MSHTAEQIRGDILMVRNKSPSKAIISLCKKQNKLYEIDSSGTIENTFKSIQNIIYRYNNK